MILAPLLSMIAIGAFFWIALARRDKRAPLFEIGSFAMLATLIYGALPLVWYTLSGFQTSPLSHGRLLAVDAQPEDFAAVAWMYVGYAATFAVAYLVARRRAPSPFAVPVESSSRTIAVLVALYVCLQIYVWAVRIMYGVNFATAYDDGLLASATAYAQLPLLARQVLDWVNAVLVIVTCALVVCLISRWRAPFARWLLLGWIVFALVDYIANPGGRFRLVAMLLSALLAYDRCVGRMRVAPLAASAGILFAGFLAAGFLRGSDLTEALESLGDSGDALPLFFTVSNEFQISYGSTIELKHLVDQGLLDVPPWQVFASEMLLPVPSQLLPFEKTDPVLWYVGETSDYFFTFGVVAQSILGLGWLELVLRGLLMGLTLALVHNWWASAPQHFWRNVFYIWLASMVYYTVRNTSFYIVAVILLRFVPLVAGVAVAQRILWPRAWAAHAWRIRSAGG